jgi:radical SAM protein with 4Fe4S-binding SPASM domain
MDGKIQITNIRWEIEPKCNLNCRHCFVGSKLDKYKEMDFETAKVVVDILSDCGIKEIIFSSKEPLMYKDIDKLIFYCNVKGIHTELVTNGTLLQNTLFAEKIVSSGVGTISISIEGITKDSNDYIRGEGNLDQVLRALGNLKNIMEYKRQIIIGIQMSLNRKNKNEAAHVPEFFNRLPIDILVIGGLSLDGNAKNNSDLLLSSDEFIQIWDVILENYLKLKDKKYYLTSKSLFPTEAVYYNCLFGSDFCPVIPKCGILKEHYSLLPNGDIVPCVALLDKINDVGEFPRINILDKILNEEKINKLENFKIQLENLIKENRPHVCRECYYKEDCRPCPVNIIQQQFKEEITIRCSRAKGKIKEIFNLIRRHFDEYYLSIRDNTLLTIQNQKVSLARYYEQGGVYRKEYELEPLQINALQKIFNFKEISLKELLYDFKNYEMLLNFIEPLVFDNFIMVRRS